jgi:class 3 adenylate cyclase
VECARFWSTWAWARQACVHWRRIGSALARRAAHGLPVSAPHLPLRSRPLPPIGLLSFLCSTTIAENLQPDEVLALLNEFQGELAAAVREHGGTIDKFMGDGMLAVFGAPEPLPDHASRALAAARAMLARIDALNAANPHRAPLRLGIGIQSGKVVAGCLGSGERLEFTVIGGTVNTASRLEALTKAKGVPVLIGEGTTGQTSAADLVPLDSVTLRGHSRPLPIFTFRELVPDTHPAQPNRPVESVDAA